MHFHLEDKLYHLSYRVHCPNSPANAKYKLLFLIP